MSYSIAVIGATTVIGHEIVNLLAERDFPIDAIHALGPRANLGRELSFGDDQTLKVEALDSFDFAGTDIAFFASDEATATEHAHRAAKGGAIVIDTSHAFHADPDVPLIVPEVNADLLDQYKNKNIIACPTDIATQLAMSLKPLHDIATLKRVVVSTYQAVSGAGKGGMDELFDQSRKFFVSDGMETQIFQKQITFNVLPQIEAFMDDGLTKQEWRLMAQTKKLLGPDIKICATCVQVPVFIGHGLAVHAEFASELTPKAARLAWKAAKGISMIERESELEYVSPAEIAGEDDIYISRTRADQSLEHGLAFWCVADNTRKGSALNAVQIAESLISGPLKK